jgi:hypothetical protein
VIAMLFVRPREILDADDQVEHSVSARRGRESGEALWSRGESSAVHTCSL